METQISDKFKAILIKVATELKKFGWAPNTQSNEIDIHQGHIDMYKIDNVGKIEVDVRADLSFVDNILGYSTEIILWSDIHGSKSFTTESNVYGVDEFTENDVNNIEKIKKAADSLNDQVYSEYEKFADEYANEQ